MSIHTQRHRGKRLLVAAAASASSLVLFGLAADPAFASYKAQVQNGVLQITGTTPQPAVKVSEGPR